MLQVGKSITGNKGNRTRSIDKIPMIHLIDTAMKTSGSAEHTSQQSETQKGITANGYPFLIKVNYMLMMHQTPPPVPPPLKTLLPNPSGVFLILVITAEVVSMATSYFIAVPTNLAAI